MKFHGLVIKSHRPVISRANYFLFFIETSVVAALISGSFVVLRAAVS